MPVSEPHLGSAAALRWLSVIAPYDVVVGLARPELGEASAHGVGGGERHESPPSLWDSVSLSTWVEIRIPAVTTSITRIRSS